MVLRLLEAQHAQYEELTAPLQFFVEASSYCAVHGEAAKESDLTTKLFHGQPVCGVTGIQQ